ncbi:transposase [candidate division WOR-3 bacterium]|nr:transposase [candidate division WOR-3 bacterium]
MDSTIQGQAGGAVKLIRKVKRVTRRKISAEDKIRIVLEGFRKELPVTDLCRREKISTAVLYSWLKQFIGVDREETLDFGSKKDLVHIYY